MLFRSKVIFNLRNAALVNFAPIADVGKFAFPRRNLSDIQIPKLDGTLTVKGDKVLISPMQINSSALNFNVKGIYALSKGTNIEMDIPLRNPRGDENLDSKQKREARMKGIVLHLKAIDDEKGGVKIRWNKDHD